MWLSPGRLACGDGQVLGQADMQAVVLTGVEMRELAADVDRTIREIINDAV